MSKIIKILLTVILVLCLIFSFSFLTACQNNGKLAKDLKALATDVEAAAKSAVSSTSTTKEEKEAKQESNEANEKIYHITSSSSNGGAISPKGEQAISEGGSITFTFTADNGFHLEYLRVDNTNLTNVTTKYTFKDVAANHTIHAQFENDSIEK